MDDTPYTGNKRLLKLAVGTEQQFNVEQNSLILWNNLAHYKFQTKLNNIVFFQENYIKALLIVQLYIYKLCGLECTLCWALK